MNNPPKKYSKVNGVVKLNPEYKRWKDAFGGEGDGQSNKVTKVQVSLYASKLKNVAGLGKGTSDPFAVVTLLANSPDDQPKILGKTEVVKNNLSPKWTTSFILDYSLGVNTRINVGLFDEIRKGNKAKPMGSAMFEIGEILGSRGNVKAKKLKQGGTLFVHAMAAPKEDAGKLMLRLQGYKLKNVDGLFSKSDPFVEISAKVNSAGGLTWQPVYRSKQIDNNLNPQWEEIEISVNKLCQGDLNAPVLVAVYDWEKSGRHKSMGSFETTVNALKSSVVPVGNNGKAIDASKAYQLYKGGKIYGKIIITQAYIKGGPVGPAHPAVTGYGSTPAPAAAASSSNAAPMTPPRPSSAQPVSTNNSPMPSTMASAAPAVASAVVVGEAKVPSYNNIPLQVGGMSPIPVPDSRGGRPKFVEYLTGGCELQMCVAIDFTGSNGDPRKPGTLHYIHKDGSLNDYEKAITAVGSVVARYDSDQKFPVWGFGAKFGGVIQHCFQVGSTPELSGISGILEGYRQVFRTGLTMSGPTVFAEVVRTAAGQARAKQAQNARVGQQAYHILLILTDGAVSDMEQTKRAIIDASDAPLSIIIVGIGNADFSTMQFLDDFLDRPGAAGRDICQFVEFNRHQHNRQSLTKETLEEVPDQLVDYFYETNGIMPMPPLSGSRFSVFESEHDPTEDVEINLDFNSGADGEIIIENPDAGVFDDTRYDTYGSYAVGGPVVTGPGPFSPPAPAPYVPSSPSRPMPMPSMPSAYGGMPTAPGSPMPTYAAPHMFHVQVPPNGHGGMQLQVQNPFTGQMMLVTVPIGLVPGQTFGVAS